MEPLPKRPRSEFDGAVLNPRFPEPQQQTQDWGGFRQGSGGSEHECRHFNTPEGCPYGSGCRFRHVIVDGKYVGQQSFSSAGKPKPCMKFFSTSGCPFGESCHFLHYVPGGLTSLGVAPAIALSASFASAPQKKATGPVGDPSVMVNGYKTKLCKRFNTAEGCKFGDRCHFAHGEGELRPPNNVSQGSKQPFPNGPTGTAPPGLSNGGSYNFANPTGYSGPPGMFSNLTAQVYAEANQPGVAGNNPGSVAYPHGNVPVF